jgi:hypothetical protein
LAEVSLAATQPPAPVVESVGGTGERRLLPPRNLATDTNTDDVVRQPDRGPSPLAAGIPPATGDSIQIVPFLAQLLAQEGADSEGPAAESDPVTLRDGLLAYRIAKGIGLDPEAEAPDDDTIILRGPTSVNLTL